MFPPNRGLRVLASSFGAALGQTVFQAHIDLDIMPLPLHLKRKRKEHLDRIWQSEVQRVAVGCT